MTTTEGVNFDPKSDMSEWQPSRGPAPEDPVLVFSQYVPCGRQSRVVLRCRRCGKLTSLELAAERLATLPRGMVCPTCQTS